MIQAITNQQIGLNVITELVAGYALPGRPVAMMIFKTFGYIVSLLFYFYLDIALGLTTIRLDLDDVTSVAIHVGHEAGSLHESPSEDYVLLSDCCYGSGGDNTTGRTAMVRTLSHQVNESNDVNSLAGCSPTFRTFARRIRVISGSSPFHFSEQL